MSAIKPGGAPLTFVAAGMVQPHDVRLIPFFRADAVRYTVYWRVYSPAEWRSHRTKTSALAARGVAQKQPRSMWSTPTTSNPSAPMRATI